MSLYIPDSILTSLLALLNEIELTLLLQKFSAKDETYLNHFIVHSSLDIVEETVWKNNAM